MSTILQPECPDADLVNGLEAVLDPEPTGLLHRWAERAAQRRALRAVNDLPAYLLDDTGLVRTTQR